MNFNSDEATRQTQVDTTSERTTPRYEYPTPSIARGSSRSSEGPRPAATPHSPIASGATTPESAHQESKQFRFRPKIG
jgi:hypothetical protein